MENLSTLSQFERMIKTQTIDDRAVGFRLDALRQATGFSKGEFADSCGIDRSSYSKIIKGEKHLKSDMAFQVAERWGVTMDYLYRGSLDKIPSNLFSDITRILNG